MCRLCEETPVYEFTNKRKLCKNCFVNYFQKKVLYIIRKFGMIKQGDIIGYRKLDDARSIVLENILLFLSDKAGLKIVKLPNNKTKKIAINSTIDSESEEIINTLINGNVNVLNKDMPIEGNKIKPLYLFTDEEILLYAKIKNLKFKQEKGNKNKINQFIDESERKHPEIKRAIVNSLLELYK